MVGAIICGLIAVGAVILGLFQLNGKGFLLNNAYIYASKKEREQLDYKQYYIQSGIVFIMLGIIFAINSVMLLFKIYWLVYPVVMLGIGMIVYAVVSEIMINKKGGEG